MATGIPKTELKNIPEYMDAFHMYFHYVGRNKRYANIYKNKMDKIEKQHKQQCL